MKLTQEVCPQWLYDSVYLALLGSMKFSIKLLALVLFHTFIFLVA